MPAAARGLRIRTPGGAYRAMPHCAMPEMPARKTRTAPAASGSAAGATSVPWWCSPAGLAVGFLLPMFALVACAVQLDLEGLTARGISFLGLGYLTLGAGLLATMAFGGWLGSHLVVAAPGSAADGPDTRDVDFGSVAIGLVALTAYLVWFRQYLASPGLLWSILSGASRPSRADELVTGVTSLANAGPVFFAVYAWRLVFRRDRPIGGWLHAICAALALLTAFRVYAWSERLALIEAVLPLALALAVRAGRSDRRIVRTLVRFGPFIALPMLMLYFGLAESVRSWASDTYNGKLGFWDFVVGRMATYYYTSLNNGAGLLATQDWPSLHFDYVASMLHTAPLSIGRVFSALVGSTGPTLDTFLERYGDIEFNNPSGLYSVVYDLGVPGGIAYFAATGVAAGMLFRRYAAGALTGALFYPLFFISYLEVFRYPYLGTGRFFASALSALLVLGLSVFAFTLRGDRSATALSSAA